MMCLAALQASCEGLYLKYGLDACRFIWKMIIQGTPTSTLLGRGGRRVALCLHRLPSSNELQFVICFLKKSGIKIMRSCT